MKPHTTHHDDCGCLSEKHRAEIDALRARADKLEGALVCANNNTKRGRLALAASQAEVRELREALAMTWPGISGYSAPQSPLGALGGDIQRTHRAATAALSRPPGDDAALREVCRRVAERAIKAGQPTHVYVDDTDASALARAADAAVCGELGYIAHSAARILGQPGDDAAPTKEE